MPRPLLIRSDQHPYHVTARCNNQDYFPLARDGSWSIFLQELARAERNYAIQIHAFVMMDNHFHLLCRTPQANLDQVMHAFQRNVAIKMLKRVEKKNHLWGGRYHWSLIANQSYYYQAYRYIFQNPVRAGIAAQVEDYPYSTLRGQMPFALHDCLGIQMGGETALLDWLNRPLGVDDQKLIRLGLRKQKFEVSQKKVRLFERLERPKGM